MMEKELKTFAEKEAEKAETLSFCRGMKLLHIRDCVKRILEEIGKREIFEQYTVHNIEHVDQMLNITEWLIPDKTKENLTSAEWLMLVLAIYFHDMGMVVTKEEYEDRDSLSAYTEFRRKAQNGIFSVEYQAFSEEEDEKYLYQEFVRDSHAKRIHDWIKRDGESFYGGSQAISELIGEILAKFDAGFKRDLAMICESHHNEDIADFSKYKIRRRYGNDSEEIVNLSYIAIILRIADLLHITRDRTPSISRRLINITNPKSILEWEKQEAVKAVAPKDKRNEDNNIDDSLEKDIIEIFADFPGAESAEAYFGLSAYLQYTRKELKKCHEIVQQAQKTENAQGYSFPWNDIVEDNIETQGFETKKLEFSIAQDNILKLLVGHTLYNDSSVVVRELVQNGLDAIRLQKLIDEKRKNKISDGKIQIVYDEGKRELTFWDNGTGMTMTEVESYLLKVGASKYREGQIKKEFPNFTSISHFGIGILTCFMVADDIDIVTNSNDQDQANSITLRKVNGKYLLKKIDKNKVDEKIRDHGTMIKLHLRSDADMSHIEADLKKWVVLPSIPVYFLQEGEEDKKIGFDSLKDVLEDYLNDTGRPVDGIKYRVEEIQQGNVTLAYAMRYHQYFSDWELIKINNENLYDIDMEIGRVYGSQEKFPIGICMEGIRVEFETPGFRGPAFLAIANVHDSNYQTNVARSAIEIGANGKILSEIYDGYVEYIGSQIKHLEDVGYSHEWARQEAFVLMEILLNDRVWRRFSVDKDIMLKRFSKLEVFVVEDQGERKYVSAEEINEYNQVSIAECIMLQQAEGLLKEIPSNVTLKSVVEAVNAEDEFFGKFRNIICNYKSSDTMLRYALRNKSVRCVEVDRKQRRIYVEYGEKTDGWYDIDRFKSGKKVLIPKADFYIEGLEGEIGVSIDNIIIMKSDSDLNKYITKVLKELLQSESDEDISLTKLFLASVFDSGILYKEQPKGDLNRTLKGIFESTHIRISENDFEKLWKRVDQEEYAKEIILKKYDIYSVYNWIRSENRKEEYFIFE